MKLSTIHLEHAIPALADLGLDGLVPLLVGGGKLEASAIAGALQGLAAGAEKRAARHLVAIAKATGEELLAWEENPDSKDRALKSAALADITEAKQAVTDFFTSLGPSQPFSLASLGAQEEKGETLDQATNLAPVR